MNDLNALTNEDDRTAAMVEKLNQLRTVETQEQRKMAAYLKRLARTIAEYERRQDESYRLAVGQAKEALEREMIDFVKALPDWRASAVLVLALNDHTEPVAASDVPNHQTCPSS
jgi:hypothetical protein